jgi:hypothetical protein
MTTFAQTSVTIDAPLATVWSIMLDLDAYPEWNPFIEKVRRRPGRAAAVGDKMVLHVRFRGGKLVESRERITTIQAPSGGKALLEYEFYGLLHLTGLIRGRRRQLLEDVNGQTLYRTEEQFRGLIASVTPVRAVQDGFERHAQALKRRAELYANS